MMLPSVEARWFMAGPVPPNALVWIQRWEFAPGVPERRQDQYLRFPVTASIGVKLREGKFEVKRRDADLGLVLLAPQATGRLALWRKWSFEVVDESAGQALDGHWITVEKERYLRKYSIEGGELRAIEPRSFPKRGCTVELTCIKVLGEKWWSVGFEAFGQEESQLGETLKTVAEVCFNVEGYPLLRGENSLDYPEWLASLSGFNSSYREWMDTQPIRD